LVKERGIGLHFKAELEQLSRLNSAAGKPVLGILGGSSLSRSLPVLELMLRRCEQICVGGAVATTLLAAKGLDMKGSSYEREQLALARNLLGRARDQKVELLLPTDFLVAEFADAAEAREASAGSIPDGAGAFDLGPRTLEAFRGRIAGAKTAWFHGALGRLENPTFAAGTKSVMSALAEAKAFGVVTGDSVAPAAAAAGPEVEQQIGFVSAGGAASLAYIDGKKLPGVEALRG
jgi:phosphoglycerate kinase